MVVRGRYVDMKPYFPHAFVATAAVVLLPFATLITVLALVAPDPPLLVTAALAVALSIGITSVGALLWERLGDSIEVSFGELMLWSWFRRWRAEEKVLAHARVLGLDKAGWRLQPAPVSREQQLELLHQLTAALESKDPYTHGHSRRVERHSYRTALALGLASWDIEDLRKAAALHDVGKIYVPTRILRKPGGLSGEERTVVEEHSVVGAQMVSSVGNPDVIAGVRSHHERFDGRGYPDGLAGVNIPLFARIVAVADAYDAMTSTRPYRAGLGRQAAIDVLRAGAGTQFDPAVVEAMISTLPLPVPVAALVPLFPFTRKMWREVAVWFKGAGAGSLAQAAGAAGAAVAISATALVPAPGPAQVLPSSGEQIIAQAPAVAVPSYESGAATDAGGLRRPRIGAVRPATAGSAPVTIARAPQDSASRRASDGPLQQASTPTQAKDDARPEVGAEPRDEPEPEPKDDPPAPDREEKRPPPEPEPEETAEPDDEPATGDPQPDHGNDCPAPAEGDPGSGPGRDRHCNG